MPFFGIITLFGIDFERCHFHKNFKSICQMNAFDLIFHLVYVFFHFEHLVSLKIYDQKNIEFFTEFFIDFYTNFMVNGPYFWYNIFFLWPKWLLDVFTINFLYFKVHYWIFIFNFFGFLGHSLKYLKFWHITRKKSSLEFLQFYFLLSIFDLWDIFRIIFRNKMQQTALKYLK